MKSYAVLFALATICVAPWAHAQTSPAGPAACPEAKTLDQLTVALDDAISGPSDKDRTCLRELMLPEVRLTPIRQQAGGDFAPRVLTLDDWINAVKGRGGAPLYEKQVKVQSEAYGHFAHLWSTYEIRSTPDGKPDVIGVNSVQAVFDGTRWRVLSILWESNATAGPVPQKYLP